MSKIKEVKEESEVVAGPSLELMVVAGQQAEGAATEPSPISDEVRERILKEELSRLESETAILVASRQAKLKQMEDDPVLWGAVDEVTQTIGVGSAAIQEFGLERSSILREFSRSYIKHIVRMTKPQGEGGRGFSLEEAIKEANRHMYSDDAEGTLAIFQRLLYEDPEHIAWSSLSELYDREPPFAEEVWKKLKQEQQDEFESGHLCAKIFQHNRECSTPLARAEFLAISESMREQWKPQGGIDTAMVDMLTVSYFLWMKWTRKAVLRGEGEPRHESYDYKQWRKDRKKFYSHNGEKRETTYSGQWLDGAWDLPYQNEAEALGQAMEIADRYRRAFQSQVRSLRDWRRYSMPVTINNPQQVNIAADGGQQVNVQRKNKTRPARSKKQIQQA